MKYISYDIYFMVSVLVKRKIVQIDEEKCDGCGQCIPNCVEGALKIIEGKAKLVSDTYCDGLGACIGHCPRNAIRIIERDAPEFDEKAVHKYLQDQQKAYEPSEKELDDEPKYSSVSKLRNWPVQLNLVSVKAPFFNRADLMLISDCVAISYPALHEHLIKDKVVLIGCPKFDDVKQYVEKLTQIFRTHNVNKVTVAVMEVPCCSGMKTIVKLAVEAAGKSIPLENLVVSVNGEILK
jgi:NAD-dependent dihydropyrimidine dehydrogenase PreA subunit